MNGENSCIDILTVVDCGERNPMYTEVSFLTGFANSFRGGMTLLLAKPVRNKTSVYIVFLSSQSTERIVFSITLKNRKRASWTREQTKVEDTVTTITIRKKVDME